MIRASKSTCTFQKKVHAYILQNKYNYTAAFVRFKSTNTSHVIALVLCPNFRDHFSWHDDGNSNEINCNLADATQNRKLRKTCVFAISSSQNYKRCKCFKKSTCTFVNVFNKYCTCNCCVLLKHSASIPCPCKKVQIVCVLLEALKIIQSET